MSVEPPRLDMKQFPPEAYRHLLQLEGLVSKQFDPILYHLIKLRASQINGCAYCLHMHSQDARRAGEREERLHLLAAWRESSLYNERERAALAWTEAVTHLAETGAPDADFEAVKRLFTEAEIVNLTLAIAMINLWNRIAVPLRTQHPKPWTAA